MNARKKHGIPSELENARRRFERWRSTQTIRTRIPDRLWATAVRVAGKHGIHQTAKTLRINYYDLKKRVEEGSGFSEMPPGEQLVTFFPLAAPAQLGVGECVLELEDRGGAKMRVHLKGVEAPDLAALSRSFLGAES